LCPSLFHVTVRLPADPNVAETLASYDGTPEFLKTLELDSDALTKAIIGTIGDVDSYQLPDAKGGAAFSRYILGVTDEERQKRREEILGTTQKDFR
jgi:Zn-dependent M16 (insulinase) family peptidase